MNLFKFGLKRVLLSMNLDVRRVGINGTSTERFANADPITYQYLANLRIAPVAPIQLAHARAGIIGFPYCRRDLANPLAVAFRAAASAGGRQTLQGKVSNILSRYYSVVRPASGLDVVDLHPDDAPGLVGLPVQSWVMPWSERSIEETAVHRRICLEEEGLARGRIVSMEDGATLYGPVTQRKLSLETARVLDLAESLGERGFQPSETDPIEVIGLRADNEYRWMVTRGQHRLAACDAFGIKTVPARIVKIVRRDDAEFWPHVVMMTFSVTGALKCFDRLFMGELSACARSWSSSSLENDAPEAWTCLGN